MSSEQRRRDQIHPPRQQRSIETMDRILDSAADLLAEHGIDAITVLDVCNAADVSTSSFYARFEGKDSLLRCLHDRHLDQTRQEIDRLTALSEREDLSLAELVHALIEEFLDFRTTHERTLQSLMLAGLRTRGLADARSALDKAGVELTTDWLCRRLATEGRDVPRTRVEFGIWSVTAAMRDSLMEPPAYARHLQLTRDQLAEEFTALFMSYLEAAADR